VANALPVDGDVILRTAPDPGFGTAANRVRCSRDSLRIDDRLPSEPPRAFI